MERLRRHALHRGRCEISQDSPKHNRAANLVRVKAVVRGRVQGVGFRFTAEQAAHDLGLTGWVKNLLDGRVEAVCEGDEPALADFLIKMKSGPMKRYIAGADVSWQAATGEFADFDISFKEEPCRA